MTPHDVQVKLNQLHTKVWIELPLPHKVTGPDAHQNLTDAAAELVCRRANQLLRRLTMPEDHKTMQTFFWSKRDQRYCIGNAGGFQVCADHGHWFNLDYFGREHDDQFDG